MSKRFPRGTLPLEERRRRGNARRGDWLAREFEPAEGVRFSRGAALLVAGGMFLLSCLIRAEKQRAAAVLLQVAPPPGDAAV